MHWESVFELITSHQFRTRSCQFRLLSCHQLFQFHASENIPAIFILHAKIKFTCFPSKTSRYYFGGKRYYKCFQKSYLMQVCKPCHYALIEAVEPFKLHPTFIWYIYERFEPLFRLWMGILLHIHNNSTTNTSPDLGKLAEILPDASVQTMPLRFDWGCRTFQTASPDHEIHIWGVWAPSQVVDGHMASHSCHYHRRCFARFGKVGWYPIWCKCVNHATMLWWGCRTFLTASHVHVIHIWGI